MRNAKTIRVASQMEAAILMDLHKQYWHHVNQANEAIGAPPVQSWRGTKERRKSGAHDVTLYPALDTKSMDGMLAKMALEAEKEEERGAHRR
jgi:molybdenum-dependent DNA-binding transcriptional regulator ModE